MHPALSPLERQQLRIAERAITFWHRVRFDLVIRLVRERRLAGVLDVGAGAGLLGDHVHQAPGKIRYRFEESSDALAAALTTRFGADAAGKPDETIDADTVITLLDVVEHIDDDVGFLSSLASRCRAGATVIVTVPALPWLFSSWDEDLGHHRRYRRDEIAQVVDAAGFDVDEANYLFPELLPIAVVRRYRRGEHTGGADFPVLPRPVDRAGSVVSGATTRLRRWWPAGTSLVVVGTARGASA